METSVATSQSVLPKVTVPPLSQCEESVVLGDGSSIRVRTIRPEDEPRLADFFRGLSQRSRALRFFTTVKDDFLDRAAARFSKADGGNTVGLIATAGSPERIVAHAMYAVTVRDRAEIAFAVEKSWREHGLGTLLLKKLAQIASSRGVRVFEAIVLPENYLMLAMFRDSGFPLCIQARARELQIEFPTDLSRCPLGRVEARQSSTGHPALVDHGGVLTESSCSINSATGRVCPYKSGSGIEGVELARGLAPQRGSP